jgi:steroid Delta-isomerase
MSTPLNNFIAFYNNLSPETLPHIDTVYSADATFQDPFNAFTGRDKIKHIFDDMYAQMTNPRFVILQTIGEGDAAFLTWDFEFQLKRLQPTVMRKIHGSTHAKFDSQGLVCYHRDYWDTGAEIYQHVPVLGWFIRKISNKFKI